MNKDKAFTINRRINILPSNFPGKREEYYNLQFKSIWSKALSISFHNKPKTFISTSSTSLMFTLTIQKYMETVTTSLNKWHWSKLSLCTLHIFARSIFINKNLSISRESKNEQRALYQTKSLLHSKGNYKQNERATYWMGEDTCQSFIW